MAQSYLKVYNPGMLSTIQDGGRRGWQASGFSVSGCMDQEAYHAANVLLNNALDAAVLELCYYGGEYEFTTETYFALTGADMKAELNEIPVTSYCAIKAVPGDVLKLGTVVTGRYTYLAVAGGFDVPVVMGSRSTNLKCGIGGYMGRKLQIGDELPIQSNCKMLLNEYLKSANPPDYKKKITVKVVLGPQDSMFTFKGRHTFSSSVYEVSQESDRMGMRLLGEPIDYQDKVDIISDGIVFGSIQVPPNGMPMVLLADRQTTGGYAKIGTVIAADLNQLVQLMPGSKIKFEVITVEEAQKQYRIYRRKLHKFEKQCGYYRPKKAFW